MDQAMYGTVISICPSLGYGYGLDTLRRTIKHDFRNIDLLNCYSNDAGDDGQRCAMLAKCFNLTSVESESYEVFLREVWNWKGMIFQPK
jgi:hypothetical protein